MKELRGRVAAITGAGSGIGRALAADLARRGTHLALADIDTDGLAATVTECEGYGVKVTSRLLDVADRDAMFAWADEVVAEHGKVNLIFNNAGVGAPGVNMEELTFEQWKNVVDINLTGVFLCTQQAIRIMKDQSPRGGRIINNGSISAHAPRPNSAPYTSTKHGVTGLTKSTSLDGRKYDIACCQIDIGNAHTDLAARMASGVEKAWISSPASLPTISAPRMRPRFGSAMTFT